MARTKAHPPERAIVVIEVRLRGEKFYVEPTEGGWAWLRRQGWHDGAGDLCASNEGIMALVRAKLTGLEQGLFVSGEWPPKATPSPDSRP